MWELRSEVAFLGLEFRAFQDTDENWHGKTGYPFLDKNKEPMPLSGLFFF